jgi:hypothetical protein
VPILSGHTYDSNSIADSHTDQRQFIIRSFYVIRTVPTSSFLTVLQQTELRCEVLILPQ